MRLGNRLATLVLVLVVLAAPLGAAGAAPLEQAPPDASAPEGGPVGDGSPGSCDENALHTALAGGGAITFDCGGPKTIVIFHQQVIGRLPLSTAAG